MTTPVEVSGRDENRLCDFCDRPETLRYLGQSFCDECSPSEEYVHTGCSICGRALDLTERRLPLCTRCEQSARAHARLDYDRRDYEREHPLDPSGRRE